MKKALIVDAFSHGNYHEVINYSYLQMISSLFEEVRYVADRSACDNMIKMQHDLSTNLNNVKFSPCNFFSFERVHGGYGYLLRTIFVGLVDLFYIIFYKFDGYFFPCNMYWGLFLVNLFAKDKTIYILCHNELEFIDCNKCKSPVERMLHFIWRRTFQTIKYKQTIKFILLGDAMKEYFRTFLPEFNRKNIYSFDHPYIRPNYNDIPKINTDNIKIGIPGLLNAQRGGALVIAILEKLKNCRIKIYALSSVDGINILNERFVYLNKSCKLRTYEEYVSDFKRMDFIFIPYSEDTYKLTASGALLEAIFEQKPIISFRNSYTEYLFNKYGNMGMLADNLNDMILILNSLDKDCIDDMIFKNLEKTKNRLLPSGQLDVFRRIVYE